MDLIIKIAAAQRDGMSPVQRRNAFLVASAAYEASGEGSPLMKKAFNRLATKDPGPSANPIASAVFGAIGRLARQAYQEKEAAGGSPAAAAAEGIRRLWPASRGAATDVLKTFGLLGVGSGAAGAAGLFALNRALSRDDPKTRELEHRRSMMKRLTREIDQELKVRGLDPTPENTAAVVDYLT